VTQWNVPMSETPASVHSAIRNPQSAIKVIGLGNVLVGDDAFGPHVVQTLLAGYEMPPEVEVLELGTPGFDLIPYLMDASALIVVDTVKSDAAPGTMKLYRRPEILDRPPPPRLSPHEPGLMETLLTLEMIGSAPQEVLVVGTVPASLKTGIALSPAVSAAVPLAVETVVEELARLGQPPARREVALEADLWWEGTPTGAPLPAGEHGGNGSGEQRSGAELEAWSSRNPQPAIRNR
jgi:hydrogenase maturation protease